MSKNNDTLPSIQDRLKCVFDALGISIYQIAKDLSENSSKFYNILNGRAKPSYDTIIQILEFYPQINADYLLRGLSPILKTDPSSGSTYQDEHFVEVPFVPIKFHATFTDTFAEGVRLEDMDTYRVSKDQIHNLKEPVIIEISGNSMSPQLVNGAKVLAVQVNPSNWIYQSGGVYAVIYRDFFVIKRIKENELMTRQYLTLHSDNPLGGSMTVPANEIRGIWKVASIVDAPVE
jgi:repressor LexA